VQNYAIPLQDWQPNLMARLGMMAVLTFMTLWVYVQLWRWLCRLLAQGWRQSWNQIVIAVLLGLAGLLVFSTEVVALYHYNSDRFPSYRRSGLLLLLLITLTVTYWGIEKLVQSPWGRVLKAIREDQEVTKALGKNVFWYKLQSLMLAGAIAGLAGAFYAWQISTIYPVSFKPQTTFDAWTIVVLGGAAHTLGPVLGSIIFWAYDSLTRFVLPELLTIEDARLGALRVMLIGLLLIVVMVWRPQGILGKKEELTLVR
jgi:neutral amino acid transport system permease protein